MNKKYDYLIVGAGIFGATIANLLHSINKKCLVIDKRNSIGGNLYCENINGINVHKYGAHIFHTNNKKIWDYLNKFCSFNNYINSPVAIYKNRLFNLPFNMNTFYQVFNERDPNKIMNLINSDKPLIKKINNLEDQAISLVGKTIYEFLIKNYTEKQWGKKCSELPPEIIKRLPIRLTFDNNYFKARYQGIPIDGYNSLFSNLLNGIEVELNRDYLDNVDFYNDIAEKIIYTGQIDKLYDYRFGRLEYRSLRFENEVLNIQNFQGNAVINYTDNIHKYTRIIEHKFFDCLNDKVLSLDKTVITKEYSQEFNILNEPYYPINDKLNNDLHQKYLKLAQNNKKMFIGGRLAEYKYLDIDQTIEHAFKLFDELNTI